MSSMSGDESEIKEDEPVRRTRSGRTVKNVTATPVKKTPSKRTTTRSTRSTKNIQDTEEESKIIDNQTSENGILQEPVQMEEEEVNDLNVEQELGSNNDEINENQPMEEEFIIQEGEETYVDEGIPIDQEHNTNDHQDIPELDIPPPAEVSSTCIGQIACKFKVQESVKPQENSNEQCIILDEDMENKEINTNNSEDIITEVTNDSCTMLENVDSIQEADHETQKLQETSKNDENCQDLIVENDSLTNASIEQSETVVEETSCQTNRENKEIVSDDEMSSDCSKKRKASKSIEKTPEKKQKIDLIGKRKQNAEGEYDPSSPTSENNDETPSKKLSNEKEEAKPVSPKKKTLPELEKYWKAVNDDPTDFTGWTYLLQYVDQENDAEAAREAYNKFLERYPYCYGYWRKYADYEKKKGDPEKVQMVFEDGLKAISLSVDLWLHYINHCKVIYEKEEEKMRQEYERAIKACGLEFRSDKLWESYIKWEINNKQLNRVLGIYDRLLSTPTLNYTTHFETFQEFVSTNPPNKILNVDDFLELRAQVKTLLKPDDTAASTDDAPPGEDLPMKEPVPSDEETRAIREKLISSRRKMHKVNVNAVAARWTFEEGIKRPYFHVKPLERCQLKNWKEYLDYEIEQQDQNRIIILFERCLIACALYDEFWMRFIRYLESLKKENTEKIRDVYYRACTIHHQRKPNLHLQWSAFEESHGNYVKAAEILENIDKVTPNMLQIAYRRINLERRRGDLDKVCELYKHYIDSSKNKTVSNNISVKYARFLCKIRNDIDKAIKILLKAAEKDKDNPRLYLQLVDLALQRNPIDRQEVIKYIDLFVDRENADLEQRVLFAQRKVEFLEDFSTDICQVLKAHEQFQKCIKQAKERKKMKEDAKNDALKKSKIDASNATQSQVTTQSSYQYNSGTTTGTYQTQQFQNNQYNNQSNYQQSYQQYPAPSDPNYANYQNWQYGQSSQTYTPYNQWGSYNYY